MIRVHRRSPCKINLVLNILGKRPDGFHELETLMHPLALHDELTIILSSKGGIALTCSQPALPVDGSNLVYRAAAAFLQKTQLHQGVQIHLEKRVPLAAGLGGGSSNAAVTLMALNELFHQPLDSEQLQVLAAGLGSDVPFFLQSGPGLGTGRGEKITPVEPFACLQGIYVLLIHPGFGVSTAWAYQALAQYPTALHGEIGRAERMIAQLRTGDLPAAAPLLYNSLEAPVLHKYPILQLYQEFLRQHGAVAALMSGSGSTTFALLPTEAAAQDLAKRFRAHFGGSCWTVVSSLA